MIDSIPDSKSGNQVLFWCNGKTDLLKSINSYSMWQILQRNPFFFLSKVLIILSPGTAMLLPHAPVSLYLSVCPAKQIEKQFEGLIHRSEL